MRKTVLQRALVRVSHRPLLRRRPHGQQRRPLQRLPVLLETLYQVLNVRLVELTLDVAGDDAAARLAVAPDSTTCLERSPPALEPPGEEEGDAGGAAVVEAAHQRRLGDEEHVLAREAPQHVEIGDVAPQSPAVDRDPGGNFTILVVAAAADLVKVDELGHACSVLQVEERGKVEAGPLRLLPVRDLGLDARVVDGEAEVAHEVVSLLAEHPVVRRRREADAVGAVVLAEDHNHLLVEQDAVGLVEDENRVVRHPDGALAGGHAAREGEGVPPGELGERHTIVVAEALVAEEHLEARRGALGGEGLHHGADHPALAVAGRHRPELPPV